MKPIHYILICCLLGLYSCRAECVCDITEFRAGVQVDSYTTKEKFNYGMAGVSRDDCPRSVYSEVYLTDSAGMYIDYDRIDCKLD